MSIYAKWLNLVFGLAMFLSPPSEAAVIVTHIDEVPADEGDANVWQMRLGSPARSDEDPFHIQINELSATSRYRVQQNAEGEKTHDRLQSRVELDMSLFFFEDRVRVDFHSATGNHFDTTWSNTGIGDGEENIEMNLRRLSVNFAVNDFLEIGLGSFAPEYGAGTQMTSLDSDGYLVGYRAKAKLEKGELVLTGGYLGDFDDPNVFNRLDTLSEFSYFQAMIHRSLSEIVSASLDYSYIGSNDQVERDDHVLRGAVKVNLSQITPWVDSIHFEYARGSSTANGESYGLAAIELKKKFEDILGKRDLKVSASFNHLSVDPDELVYPVHGISFEGAFYRLQAELTNLLQTDGRGGQLSLYTRWIQSLEESEEWRFEIGLKWAF